MDGAYVVDSVTSETAPWVHAANLEQAQFVRQALRGADVLVVDLDGSKMLTLEQLFAEYKQNFSFPDYFGGNWSAFDECLKDLEWLPARRYLTIISNAELVLSRESAEQQTYLRAVQDVGKAWSTTVGLGYERGHADIPFNTVLVEGAVDLRWRF